MEPLHISQVLALRLVFDLKPKLAAEVGLALELDSPAQFAAELLRDFIRYAQAHAAANRVLRYLLVALALVQHLGQLARLGIAHSDARIVDGNHELKLLLERYEHLYLALEGEPNGVQKYVHEHLHEAFLV